MVKEIDKLKVELECITLKYSLLSKLSKDFELARILNSIGEELEKANRNNDFEGFAISVIDNSRLYLSIEKLKLYSKFDELSKIVTKVKIPLSSEHAMSKCFRENRFISIHKENVREYGVETEAVFNLWGINHGVYFPIYDAETPLGVIFLYKTSGEVKKSVSNKVVKYIRLFSGILKHSLYYSFLKEQESDSKILADKNRKILEISENLNKLNSLEAVYELIQKEILQIFNFDISSLFFEENNHLDYTCSCVLDKNKYGDALIVLDRYLKDIKGYYLELTEGSPAIAYIRNIHFYFQDLPSLLSLPMSAKDKEYLSVLKTPKTLLVMPLRYKANPVGIIALFSLEEINVLTDLDLEILSSLCSFVTTAINNAKLYTLVDEQKNLLKKQTSELQKANYEIENIIEISREINSTLDFDKVFNKVVEYLRRTYGFEGYSLGLVTPDEKHYKVEFWILPEYMKNLEKGFSNNIYPLNENGGIVAECINQKKVFFFTDIDPAAIKDEINRKVIEFFNIKTVLNLPIIIENKAIGSFSLSSHNKSIYLNENDIAAITRFVIQIASAIKNSKLYAEIEKQKSFSNSLLDNSPYGIQVIDKSGKVIYVNPACLKISGYKKAKIEGITWTAHKSIINTGLAADFEKALSGELVHRENINFKSDITGTSQLLNLTISPITNSKNEIENVLVMYYDNTEKARIEENVKNLLEELQNKDRILTEDLSMAMRIQKNILPAVSDLLKYKDFKFSIKYEPQSIVGGDIYDVYPVKDDYYRLFIADATGHGVQAALITMIIKTEYDKIKLFELGCDKILDLLNSTFYSNYSQLTVFFSSIVVDIDNKNNLLHYSSAGHPAQYLIKADNTEIIPLSSKGRLIGVLPAIDLTTDTISFQKGDKLILFTDGIFEEFNEAGLMFGEERLLELLELNKHLNIHDLTDKIFEVIINFCGKNSIEDDVTIIAVEL